MATSLGIFIPKVEGSTSQGGIGTDPSCMHNPDGIKKVLPPAVARARGPSAAAARALAPLGGTGQPSASAARALASLQGTR